MTFQSIASIVRQILAVLVTIYGVLSATVSALHLPPAISAVLTAVGPVLLTVEHYLGDPSTGTTNAPTSVPSSTVREQIPAPPVP